MATFIFSLLNCTERRKRKMCYYFNSLLEIIKYCNKFHFPNQRVTALKWNKTIKFHLSFSLYSISREYGNDNFFNKDFSQCTLKKNYRKRKGVLFNFMFKHTKQGFFCLNLNMRKLLSILFSLISIRKKILISHRNLQFQFFICLKENFPNSYTNTSSSFLTKSWKTSSKL